MLGGATQVSYHLQPCPSVLFWRVTLGSVENLKCVFSVPASRSLSFAHPGRAISVASQGSGPMQSFLACVQCICACLRGSPTGIRPEGVHALYFCVQLITVHRGCPAVLLDPLSPLASGHGADIQSSAVPFLQEGSCEPSRAECVV